MIHHLMPISDQELADFIAWLDRMMAYHHKMRGTRQVVQRRHTELLEHLRHRAFAKIPYQTELFG